MHLTSLGIENIRVFSRRQKISLAPLAILTGPNNSGKSTLTKTLLLLKDTFTRFSTGNRFTPRVTAQKLEYNYFERHVFPYHLVFDGLSGHSLGSFRSILSINSKTDTISIQLPFIFPEIVDDNEGTLVLTYGQNYGDNQLKKIEIILREEPIYAASLEYEENKIVKQHTRFNIRFFEKLYNERQYHLRNEEPLVFTTSSLYEFCTYEGLAHELSFSSCMEDFSKYYYPFKGEDRDLPDNYFDLLPSPEGEANEEYREELGELENRFLESISGDGFLELESSQESYAENGTESLLSQFNSLFARYLLQTLSARDGLDHLFLGKYDETYHEYTEKFGELEWNVYNPGHRTYMLLGIIDRSVSFNLESYSALLGNCNLLSIVDVGFEELVNRKEERLFNLLDRVSQIQSYDLKQRDAHTEYRVQSFINESLKMLDLGEEIIVEKVKDYGFEIQLDTGRGLIPLRNQGFGIRKLVSLILGIASQAHNSHFEMSETGFARDSQVKFNPNLIILEEPEANLHPAYQSALAEILLMASGWFNMQCVVETHSEYMIRKFQHLTAGESPLSPGDVAITYFSKITEKDGPVSISIERDGALSDDFGPGFYDEALKTKISLVKLKSSGHG